MPGGRWWARGSNLFWTMGSEAGFSWLVAPSYGIHMQANSWPFWASVFWPTGLSLCGLALALFSMALSGTDLQATLQLTSAQHPDAPLAQDPWISASEHPVPRSSTVVPYSSDSQGDMSVAADRRFLWGLSGLQAILERLAQLWGLVNKTASVTKPISMLAVPKLKGSRVRAMDT